MKKQFPIGPLAILAGALCSSTAGTAQALAPEGATSIAMGILRMLGGGVSLFLFCCITRNLPRLFGWPWKRICCAAAGLLSCQLCFFIAAQMIGVAIGTVIVIGSSPIFVGCLGWLVLKEKPTALWWVATVIAITGLSLLTFSGGEGGSGEFQLGGVCLAALAGGSYAVFLLCAQPLLKQYDPIHIMTVVFLLGGSIVIPVLVMQPLGWIASVRGALVVLDLGVVTTAMAFSLILYGMRTTPVAVTSTLGLAEPLGAALLGIFVLHESINMWGGVGIGLLFVSMVLLVLKRDENRPSLPDEQDISKKQALQSV